MLCLVAETQKFGILLKEIILLSQEEDYVMIVNVSTISQIQIDWIAKLIFQYPVTTHSSEHIMRPIELWVARTRH